VYKDAAGSGAVTLSRGECILRFVHTYGQPTGQVDAITFVPVAATDLAARSTPAWK